MESKKTGLVIHRRERLKYSVIFGVVEVNSPYLWHKQEGWGVSPVKEKLGIKQGKEVVFNFAKYLERFRQCLHYEKYRDLGLPIGSGEIESAHQYIPQKRLKIPGATWHPQTINPMLALRVIRANNWWDDFWYTYTCSEKPLMA